MVGAITSPRPTDHLSELAGAIDATAQALDAQLAAISREIVPLRNGALTADAGAVRAATGRIGRAAEQARTACATLGALSQTLTTPLHPAPTEVADLLMAIIPRWKSLAPSHSFELALTGPEPTVLADAARVEQAIMALLEYAVALAPEGGDVRVTLRERRSAPPAQPNARHELRDGHDEPAEERPQLARLDALGGGAIISVRGQYGQAALAEALAQIGEPLGSARGRGDEIHPGGLGLHLAQTIAAQHGGQLWADAPASGAALTLYLALPFTLPAQTLTQRGDVAPSGETASGARSNVVSAVSARLPVTHLQPVTLIIEGDQRMARYLRANFEAQRYRALNAATLDEALHLIDLEEPDLLLLDASLPDVEPLEALERLLSYTSAPCILLSRANDPLQCVRAIDLGASDYIALPFSMDELLARTRAALRVASRTQTAQSEAAREPIFANGPLRIDYAQRLVTVADKSVSLSKTEYKLLRTLAQHAGMALTHETLLERVWGPAYNQEVEFIWVYVRRLRRKIELDPAHSSFSPCRASAIAAPGGEARVLTQVGGALISGKDLIGGSGASRLRMTFVTGIVCNERPAQSRLRSVGSAPTSISVQGVRANAPERYHPDCSSSVPCCNRKGF